ncbi:MAG: DUF4386 domain-containing protein [Chloroflexi bacterium]|nr:DUF4386 domain-containing protein [Chloroflexota bacterium]
MNTKSSPHETNRTTATIVGVLYIIGTVSGILSVVFTQSILTDPDYLRQVAVHENQIIIGLLFVLTMALALAMVPVMLFPILKKYNEVLALGYLIFRGALETVAYIAMIVTRLFLIIVSQQSTGAGTQASYFQTLGAVLQSGHDSINTLLIIVFSLDALMLYSVFYQSKLIPRWISIWGLIAIVMHVSTAFLILFRVVAPGMSPVIFVINFPILVQEMVMAVWLIVKGFNPAAIASLLKET